MKFGITGHQFIPPEGQTSIESKMNRILDDYRSESLIGLSSLAVGADQLFASSLLKSGGQLHVILPSENYETTFSTARDLGIFRDLLKKATKVEVLDFAEPTEESFLAAGYRIVDLCDCLLAVWDGLPARGKGGTADIVEYANMHGRFLEVIWPRGLQR